MGKEIDIESHLLKTGPKKGPNQNVLGCLLAFISGVMFVTNKFIIQWLQLDYTDIMLVRSTIQMALIGSLCYLNNLSLFPMQETSKKTRFFLVFQGLPYALMITMGIECVRLMPLGDASTLILSAPIFTICFAALCLKHDFGPFRIAFAILLMVGTILVVQPPLIFDTTDHETNYKLYYVGAILGISTAVIDGIVNISINFCIEVHYLVLLWWSGIGGLLVALISATFNTEAKILSLEIVDITYQHWIGYIVMTFFGLVAYFSMTRALQLIDPTVVSFIRSLEIILAYVVQVLMMQQSLDYLACIGAALVLFSVGSVALQDFCKKK